MMFGENGLRDYGSYAARFNQTQDGGHHMDKEENQIAHARF
jgi:hypothetical protein